MGNSLKLPLVAVLLCAALACAALAAALFAARRVNPAGAVATSVERPAQYSCVGFPDGLVLGETSPKLGLTAEGELPVLTWEKIEIYALDALPPELQGANWLARDGRFSAHPAPDFTRGTARFVGQSAAYPCCSSQRLPVMLLRFAGGRQLTGCLRAGASRRPLFAPFGTPPSVPEWSELQLRQPVPARLVTGQWYIGGISPQYHFLQGTQRWYLAETNEAVLPPAWRTPPRLRAAGYRSYVLCDRQALEQALR